MENPAPNALEGRRILIVEDEMILALALEDLFLSQGAVVLGPLSTVARVFRHLAADRPDCVSLDMNLNGESSLPITHELRRLAIPFVIVSGYGELYAEQPQLEGIPFLRKPFADEDLLMALRSVLS